MRATIRSLTSLDVDNLDSWIPGVEAWQLGLHLIAGPNDGPGDESFVITVCSLEWLTEQVRRDRAFDGRHHLIVDRFNWPELRTYIERRVWLCEGATWREVAEESDGSAIGSSRTISRALAH